MIDRLLNTVQRKRPKLFGLLEREGELPLEDYAKALYQNPKGASEVACQILEQQVRELYGFSSASMVREQISRAGIVNTGDHHAILGHHTIFQGNILASLASSPVYIVLAFGNIPLNNDSYPRGVILGDAKYPLFPDRDKLSLVYGCRAFRDREKLPNRLKEHFDIDDIVFSLELLSQQISLINSRIWKLCCPTLPPMIYIQAEDLIRELLIDNIRNEGVLFDILFDDRLRQRVLERFRGVAGAWSENSGTHFFWGRDEKGRAVRYSKMTLSPDDVIKGLTNKTLLPGLFLSFTALILSGFRCLGGFSQVDYLSEMVDGLSKLELIEYQERTDGFTLGPLFLINDDGIVTTKNLLDSPYDGKVPKISLKTASLLGLHKMYGALVPTVEREDEILAYSTLELARELGVI